MNQLAPPPPAGVAAGGRSPFTAAEVAQMAAAGAFDDVKVELNAEGGIGHHRVVDGARSVAHVLPHPLDGDHASIATVASGDPLGAPGSDQAIVVA